MLAFNVLSKSIWIILILVTDTLILKLVTDVTRQNKRTSNRCGDVKTRELVTHVIMSKQGN